MTDTTTPSNPELVTRFAALVALAVEQPTAGGELRDAAKRVVEAAKSGGVTFACVDGVLSVDGSPLDAPVLAGRFAAYGVEELGVTPRASQADLLDLARLLAASPGDGDPVARFASRAAVLDTKALPRRLRARSAPPVEPVPLVAPARLTGPTPSTTRPVTPPVTPAVTPPVTPPVTPSVAQPVVPAPPEARDAPVRLVAPLAVPEASNPTLASAITALQHAEEPKRLTHALELMVSFCDLAFRQGRQGDLVEGVAALIAIEFVQLERDGTDGPRQAFNHAVRRLARPVLLRQLATLRHARAGDALATERLQAALYRFGVDGAEAMIDEIACAADGAALAACLESLRGLPRAHEALRAQLTHPNELVARQAIAILGALRGAESERTLDGALDHPDARTRRDVVAAFAKLEGEEAFTSLALALGDESPMVRLRAVTALGARREARVLPLLEPLLKSEPDREVLFAVVDTVGAIGTAEAVPMLIQVAQGGGTNPQRDLAALRIQACIALVAIRTPQAMAAVQVLRDDRDREVRQASMRLVAHARRRPTTQSVAAVSEP